MHEFIYVGGIDDKYIYYIEEKDEFYAVDENFFATEVEKDIEVPSAFFKLEKLEMLESVRFTDEQQLKSLRYMYKLLKKYQKREVLYKVRDKFKETKDSITPEMRRDISKYFATTCIFTFIAILIYLKTEPQREQLINDFEEKIDKYRSENQNDAENLQSFYAAIDANSTISAELKSVLKNDFKVWTYTLTVSAFSRHGFTIFFLCQQNE